MLDRKIEIFDNQVDLFIRIEELKGLGYEEKDMYIIANEDENVAILRGLTDIMIKEDSDSIIDRFKSFLKGEDSVIDAFKRIGLEDEERDNYYDEVKNGKIVILVDKDYHSYFQLNADGIFEPIDERLIHNKNATLIEKLNEEPMPENIKKDIGLNIEEYENQTEQLIIRQTLKVNRDIK